MGNCWVVCLLACGLFMTGCTLDPRPHALRRGLDQVRSVLADPRLHRLAQKDSKGPWEVRLVETLFSPAARGFWPPRLEAEYDFRYADQSKLPGRIAYLKAPDLPWSVVVVADPKQHRILLLGYGMQLDKPLLQDAMPAPPASGFPPTPGSPPAPPTQGSPPATPTPGSPPATPMPGGPQP